MVARGADTEGFALGTPLYFQGRLGLGVSRIACGSRIAWDEIGGRADTQGARRPLGTPGTRGLCPLVNHPPGARALGAQGPPDPRLNPAGGPPPDPRGAVGHGPREGTGGPPPDPRLNPAGGPPRARPRTPVVRGIDRGRAPGARPRTPS